MPPDSETCHDDTKNELDCALGNLKAAQAFLSVAAEKLTAGQRTVAIISIRFARDYLDLAISGQKAGVKRKKEKTDD